MKTPVLSMLLLLLQAPQVSSPPQAETPGSIAGIVVSSENGMPVAGALVSWTSSLDPRNSFNGPNPNAPTTTGTDGRFEFKELKPATYRLAVTANGYVRREYGQKVAYGTGTPVYLAAGQTVKDLSVSITPSATVAGRVVSTAGQPASEILVQLVQVTYGTQGKGYRGVGMTNADDRGQFRLFGVTPGRYYLVAGNVNVAQTLAPGEGDVIDIMMSRTDYGTTFYPGVSDIGAASLLELKPGAEVRVDLTAIPQQRYRVSGRVVDETGQGAGAATISLASQFSPTSSVQPILSVRNSSTTPGTFEFLNVPPGPWLVRAEVRAQVQAAPGPVDPAVIAARSAAQAQRPYGQATFEITNGNIDGLQVTLRTGVTIPARISLEGGQPLSALTNLDRISIQFQPSVNGRLTQVLNAGAAAASRPAPDGTFQITGVREGEYLARVSGLPPGFYVKSIRYGNEEVSQAPVRFSNSDLHAIEIVIRPGAGQISGAVTDAKAQPVPGIQAILIPEESLRHRSDLYKTVVTDRNGQFTIPNVATGDYKVFSWEGLPQNGFYDPDLMRRYESQGRAVHLEESSNATADVQLIPAN